MRTTYTLLLLFALVAAAGCGESSAHGTSSDYRYYDVDKPMLAIERQHFGGGTLVTPKRRTYPYGLDLSNLSRTAIAEQVRIRFRIYKGTFAVDDQVVQVGDLRPGDTRRVEGSFEVEALYTGSAVDLTWQYDSQLNTVNILQPATLLEDLPRDTY